MRKESYTIRQERGFQVQEIGRDRAREMTDFIYETYFARFRERYGYLGHDDYVEMAIEDLFNINRSTIFAAVADGSDELLGSIRIIERQAPLPAEKEFDFDVLDEFERRFSRLLFEKQRAFPRVNRVFEIGRFATNCDALRRAGLRKSDSLFITDCLLREMFGMISAQNDNLTVASLDVTTLRILKMRGIHFRELGASRDYLGSPTVPVMLPVDLCLSEMHTMAPRRHDFYMTAYEPADRVSA